MSIVIKENYKKDTKDLEYSVLSLNIKGLSCVYLNTIKRILYNYIPTYAFNFDNIIIEKTKSFLDNSRLRDRFMFLPILNIKNDIDYLDEKYYKDKLGHIISFENENRERHPKEKSIVVSFNDYNKKEKMKNIDTNSIEYFINDKPSDIPYNKKFPILLCYLRNGDNINCVMKSSLGYGFIHPIYQPVYHTYYREVKDKEYEFIIHSKGQNTETELLKRCCNAAVLNLEEIKKKSWNLLHKNNEFTALVYEYKSYKENENMKVLLFDDFTFANIICEELQNNKSVEFAGVNKDNYFDQDVQLRVRFKTKDEKEHYKILNDSIDECIRKFKEIKKMIK